MTQHATSDTVKRNAVALGPWISVTLAVIMLMLGSLQILHTTADYFNGQKCRGVASKAFDDAFSELLLDVAFQAREDYQQDAIDLRNASIARDAAYQQC